MCGYNERGDIRVSMYQCMRIQGAPLLGQAYVYILSLS